MATTYNNGVSIVTDYDFLAKFERDIDKLRELLFAADWRKLAPGQVLRTHVLTGTFQAAQTTAGAAVTASTYSDAGTDQVLVINRWKGLTPVEDVAAYGRDEAIVRNDSALLKDIQKSIVGGIMTGISTGATGTASGTGLLATAAAAWGALGTACDNEVATPVFFANYKEAAKYLGAQTVSMQQAFGLTYLMNFLGGVLILDSNVPDNKIWCTAMENIIIGTADLSDVAEFGMTMDESGIIAVAHKADDDHGSIATHAWCGIKTVTSFKDRVIVGTIS